MTEVLAGDIGGTKTLLAAFDGVAFPPSFSLKGYPGLFFGMGALVFLLAAMGA